MKTKMKKRSKRRRPKVTPAQLPAPVVPSVPAPPAKPWWSSDYRLKLKPEPVLDPENGQTLGYAVLVMHEQGFPAGVIAVILPSGGNDVAHARWAAHNAANRPSLLDAWASVPDVKDYRDRPPFVPLPFNPSPYVHQEILEMWRTGKRPFHPCNDLAGITRQMARSVWANRPPTDPLSILFERAVRKDVDDRYPPPLVLGHACAAFWRLPPDERRRLRNGWDYDVRNPVGTNQTRGMTEYGSQTVLAMSYKDDTAKGVIEWAHTDVHERDPVRLLVYSDTPKEHTVKAVRAMLERLEKDWDVLVVEQPDDV